MRLPLCAALVGSTSLATASSSRYSARPQIIPSPEQPRVAVPDPPERTKFCEVKTHGNGSDDSAYILSAFNECNNGGHVLFSENTTYTIGTAMDWTFLEHIDIGERHFQTAKLCGTDYLQGTRVISWWLLLALSEVFEMLTRRTGRYQGNYQIHR